MIAKKITLTHFETKNNSIINLPKSSPYWPQVDRHIIEIDDEGNIYILNLWNNQILVYDGNGKLKKKIELAVKLGRFDYRNGALEVSGDGKRFWVDGYNESGILVQSIIDEKGSLIKQFPEDDIWSFPDRRLCNNTYVVFRGGYLYDKNFKLLSEKFTGFADPEGQYRVIKKTLSKNSSTGNKLWEKPFDGNYGIVGIDANDNIYIHGVLKKGDSNSLYKLNSKGDILAQAPVPDPFPFKTKAEKDEREMHSSEEYLSFFKVACNGDVYLIYQLGELPEDTFKRWLKGGEYFIYKFESAK